MDMSDVGEIDTIFVRRTPVELWSDADFSLQRRAPVVKTRTNTCCADQCISKWIGNLHVMAVCIAVAWDWYILLFDVILRRMTVHIALLHFVVLLWVGVGLVVNYFATMTANNTIPDCYVPSLPEHDGGRCLFCKRTKPARAYHCHACGTCQLKRDHHSYFVRNCIGLFNYRHYVSLLLYASLHAAFNVYVLWPFARDALWLREREHPLAFTVAFVASGCALIPLSCGFVIHCYLIVRNRSAHECVGTEGSFKDNVFDLGPVENWKQVFGDEPWALLWPFLAPNPGRLLEFPLNGKQVHSHLRSPVPIPLPLATSLSLNLGPKHMDSPREVSMEIGDTDARYRFDGGSEASRSASPTNSACSSLSLSPIPSAEAASSSSVTVTVATPSNTTSRRSPPLTTVSSPRGESEPWTASVVTAGTWQRNQTTDSRRSHVEDARSL